MLLQFVVLRRISGRRRTRVLVAMCVLWAIARLTLGLTDVVAGSLAAAAGVLAFNGIFALGETLLQPTIPAITNDMAPDHLRGRYNAINAGAFQTGTIMGPVVAGFMLNHGWSWAFISMIIVGCGLMACPALVVERLITPAINGISPGDTTLLTDPTTGGTGRRRLRRVLSRPSGRQRRRRGSRRGP
ncbi:MFS transporter [Nocardioides sp. B-3]|uniref:MFS transporter n=1 Tax=Nocardioides sp. B-3 TaxID=2895565 RepID=UPI0021538557|nr:MFS transporter [Nocardioides sp. B-3]UUZ61374.1 MFS transporter [Nocardioides sp. B-3]